MNQDKPGYQSVLSQLTGAIIGRGWIYRITIGSVLASLCLSANTSFVDFPRLCRLIAEDGFCPDPSPRLGGNWCTRLGLFFLASTAGLLLIVFGGITRTFIPLFAVGAFLAFTLSQAGMVVHWRKELRQSRSDKPTPPAGNGDAAKPDVRSSPICRPSLRAPSRHRTRLRLWVNGVGAVATGVALAIILAAKFVEGAWITVVAIPTLLTLF